MCVVLLYYCVIKDYRRIYGCDYGSYDDGWQVCYFIMLHVSVNVLFVIRRDTRKDLSFHARLCSSEFRASTLVRVRKVKISSCDRAKCRVEPLLELSL